MPYKSLNPIKIENLEQYDYYDSDYIEKRRRLIAPLIGNFFISFSQFEHDLNTSLAELIGDGSHDIGYVLIRNMEMVEKITIFSDLLYQYMSAMESKNKDLLKKIKQAMIELVEFRNKVAHANWNTLEKGDYVRVKIKPSKESGFITFTKEILSPKIIKTFIKKIDSTCNDLYELLEKEQLN
ncbi:hypothetical protein HYV31_02000 [candidate division WWE3 bacterium]|nr:hypothetical protein [candidate division WWE3 bacterium]